MSTLVQERTTFQRQLLTAELTKSVLLSPQTKHLEFRVAGVDEFRFTPGQFVSIKQPRPDGKMHTRAYSIASAPRPAPTFDLCLNRVEEGFLSNWLCDLEVGATIQFHGPHGLFVLREPRKDAIFIATGTGVAPIRSMVQWLFDSPERNRGHQYWLVFGTRHEHSLYYREEFERIERENPNFHYVPTLSRCGDEWPGCRGYVQDHVRAIVAGDMRAREPGPGALEAYVCGLNQMVAAVRKLLTEELGWDRKQVIFERFD
ncbi:MAG TPA: FAD-binding oxidoreductase [Bryobacteraceae bacterium]|nr:FAD-binding oxidoreductase [Bryobacteraceae bacterium]